MNLQMWVYTILNRLALLTISSQIMFNGTQARSANGWKQFTYKLSANLFWSSSKVGFFHVAWLLKCQSKNRLKCQSEFNHCINETQILKNAVLFTDQFSWPLTMGQARNVLAFVNEFLAHHIINLIRSLFTLLTTTTTLPTSSSLF